MKHYETVFILTPVLSDEQMKEAVKKVQDFMKDNDAKIYHQEDWGLRKLAYPIQKKSNGFYHLMEYNAEPSFIKELEIMFKRDERVIRFLTIALDKHSIAFSERRRKKKQEAAKAKA